MTSLADKARAAALKFHDLDDLVADGGVLFSYEERSVAATAEAIERVAREFAYDAVEAWRDARGRPTPVQDSIAVAIKAAAEAKAK
jgi:hypothetical protein